MTYEMESIRILMATSDTMRVAVDCSDGRTVTFGHEFAVELQRLVAKLDAAQDRIRELEHEAASWRANATTKECVIQEMERDAEKLTRDDAPVGYANERDLSEIEESTALLRPVQSETFSVPLYRRP
jgi:hypothetical protein